MLVMLDLDNTLSDRAAAVGTWVDEFVVDRGLPDRERAWILDRDQDGYSDRRDVFEAIIDRYALADPIDDLLTAYQRRVIELSTPTPGATSCLQDLRAAGHVLAIVSNGSSIQQHGKIDALGLRDLVDAVIISGDLDIKKPDPRIFEAASSAAGLPLGQAWMVGDSPLHDVVGADRCEAKTAWLNRGRTWTDPTTEPTVTIGSLAELLPAIESAAAG
ncbi:MAG: HAD family hydrolase [Acidimicrobiia bacterium]|nr:HAD family hydrolase [Acidimicrobiia bacterium]